MICPSPIDGHETIGTVGSIEDVFIAASGFGIGQFGSVEYFASIAESEEHAQVKILVTEVIVETSRRRGE